MVHSAPVTAAGIQQDDVRTPVSSSRAFDTALRPLSNMDPGSGAFGAALAAAERASVTPKHRIGRSLSHVSQHDHHTCNKP